MGWKASDYIKGIEGYLGRAVGIALINNEVPSDEQVEAYKLEEGDGVLVEDDYTGDNALRVPLLSHAVIQKIEGDAIHSLRSFIRHDSTKIADAIKSYIS